MIHFEIVPKFSKMRGGCGGSYSYFSHYTAILSPSCLLDQVLLFLIVSRYPASSRAATQPTFLALPTFHPNAVQIAPLALIPTAVVSVAIPSSQ